MSSPFSLPCLRRPGAMGGDGKGGKGGTGVRWVAGSGKSGKGGDGKSGKGGEQTRTVRFAGFYTCDCPHRLGGPCDLGWHSSKYRLRCILRDHLCAAHNYDPEEAMLKAGTGMFFVQVDPQIQFVNSEEPRLRGARGRSRSRSPVAKSDETRENIAARYLAAAEASRELAELGAHVEEVFSQHAEDFESLRTAP